MTYRSLFLSCTFAVSSLFSLASFADWQSPLLVKKSESFTSFDQEIPLIDSQRNLMVLWTRGSDFRQSRFDQRFIDTNYVWVEGSLGAASVQGVPLASTDENGNVFAFWQDGQKASANYFSPADGWHQEDVLNGVNAGAGVSSAVMAGNNEVFFVWPLSGDSEAKEYRIYSSRHTTSDGWTQVQEIARNPLNVSQTIRPQIAVNNNRQAIIVWEEVEFDESEQQYFGQIWVSLFNPATNQWTTPKQIKSDLRRISTSTSPIKTAIDSAGNAFVFYDLFASYCANCVTSQTWSETTLADNGPEVGAFSAPNYRFGFDASNNLVTMWEEQVKVGEVYYLRLFSRRFDAARAVWGGKVRLDSDNTHSVVRDSSAAVLSVLENGNALVSWVQMRNISPTVEEGALWGRFLINGAWSATAAVLGQGSINSIRSEAASSGNKVALSWLNSEANSSTLSAKVFNADLRIPSSDTVALINGRNPNPVLKRAFVHEQDDFVLGWRDEVTEPSPSGGSRIRQQIRVSVYHGDYAAPIVPSCDGSPDAIDALSKSSVSGAEPSTMQYSAVFTVTGLDEGCPTQISIDRGAYSKNGSTPISTPGYVKNGDRIRVRLQSPLEFGNGVTPQSLTAKLLIGDVADYFTVTNKLAPSSVGGDSSPDPFSISSINNAAPLSEVQSETILISGINAPTTVSIENGVFKIGESEWRTGSAIISSSTQGIPSIKIKVVASEIYGGSKTATLHVGNKSADFVVTTMPSEDNSNVRPQTEVKFNDAQLSTVYTASWKIIGLPGSGVLSVSNGLFAINNGAFSSAAKIVQNGDLVTLSHTSAPTYETLSSSTIMLGNIIWGKISSQTSAQDYQIAPFNLKFQQTDNIVPGAILKSYVIIVDGINMPVPISVNGAQYSVNGGAFTSKAGMVSYHDMVTVRVTMPNANAAIATPSITIGGLTQSVTLKTQLASGETTPDPDEDDGRSVSGENPIDGGGGGGGAASYLMVAMLAGLLRRRKAI